MGLLLGHTPNTEYDKLIIILRIQNNMHYHLKMCKEIPNWEMSNAFTFYPGPLINECIALNAGKMVMMLHILRTNSLDSTDLNVID